MTGPTRAVRAEVIRRDGGMCVVTGRQVVDPDTLVPFVQYSLQHRRARGAGGSKDPVTNSPANLLLVEGTGTTGAHGRIESEREWARRLGYAVPQWRNPVDVPVLHRVHGWSWVGETGYVPLSQGELWLQAGEWLADEARLRNVDPSEGEFMSLSRAAAELYGLKAKEAA